jgi:ribosomal protein L17
MTSSIESSVDAMSPADRQAMRAKFTALWSGEKDPEGNLIPSPFEVGFGRYVALNAANMLPSWGPMLIPGGVLAKVAISGITMGAPSAGEMYTRLYDGVMKAPQSEMEQSPAYTAAIKAGQSDEQARLEVLRGAAILSVGTAGALGTAAGAGVGGILARGALGGGERIASRMGIGAAEAGATMGVQGAGTELAGQYGEKRAGIRQNYDIGQVIAEGVSQGLTGAALGAVGGVFHRPTAAEVREEERPPAPGVSSDTSAALTEALTPSTPEPGGPTTTADMSGIPGYSPSGVETIPRRPMPAPPAPPVAAGEPTGIPGWSPEGPAPTGSTAAPASAPPTAPETTPGVPPTPSAAPRPTPQAAPQAAPEVRPSAGMKAGELRDALTQMTGRAPPVKTSVGDLRTAYDREVARQASSTVASDVTGRQVGSQAPGGDGGPEPEAVAGKAAPSSEVDQPVGSLPVVTPSTEAARVEAETQAEPGPDITVAPTEAVSSQVAQGETAPAGREAAPTPKGEAAEDAVEPAKPKITPTKGDTIAGYNVDHDKVTGQVHAVAKDGVIAVRDSNGELHAVTPENVLEHTPKPLTKGEQLRAERVAKRAAEKAKLTGEKIEPATAHVAGEEQEVETKAPEREPRSLPEARQDVRDALEMAQRDIQPVKGVKASQVAQKAAQELGERFAKAKTEGDLHDAIAHWGSDNPNPLPLSTTRRSALADRMLKLLTGKGLDEYRTGETPEARAARVAAEAREEIARQPKAVEDERTQRKTALEEAHARDADVEREVAHEVGEAAAPEAEAEVTPVVKEPEAATKAKTTSKAREAERLLKDVLDGKKTPVQASEEYGLPKKGAKPRGEGLRTFLEYLVNEAKRAESEGERERIIAKSEAQNKASERAGGEHPNKKKARTETLQRELQRVGPEYAEKIRGYAREIADPIRKAADEAAAVKQAAAEKIAAKLGKGPQEMAAPERATPDGIGPSASRFVQMARDPRIGANLVRHLKAAAAVGRTLSLHDVLRFVRDDPLVRAEARPLHALAMRLLSSRLLPDVPVLTPEQGRARGLVDDQRMARFRSGNLYGYSAMEHSTPHIVLNPDTSFGHIETALHEAMHAVTSRYIEHLRETAPNHPDLQVLRAIKRELNDQKDLAYMTGRISGDQLDRINYALKDEHELHTALMTSPEVQAFAAGGQASDGLRAELSRLGFPPREQGRSVWRYFTDWVRRALGMDKPATVSEYTLLDHLLRPMQEITERGGEYGRSMDELRQFQREFEHDAPRDPELRAQAEPLYRTATSSMGDRVRDTADRALEHLPDAHTMGDKGQQFLLNGATTDGIVSRYKPLIPSLETWRNAREAIARVGKVFSDKFADATYKLTNGYAQIKDRNALGQLMNDATIAEAKLGSGVAADANAHLTTPAQKAALADLQARYNGLSDKAKAFYDNARDMYQQWHTTKRDAEKRSLLNTWWPDASDIDRKAFLKAATSKTAMEKYIGSEISPKLGRAIGKIYSQGFVRGDYFPLRRHGDYVVRYGDRDDPTKYGVEMFEKRRDAEARRKELLARGDVDDVYQVSQRSRSSIRDIAPDHPAVAELTDAMIARGTPTAEAHAVRDQLQSILLDHATRSEVARANMRRKGVKGASIDQGRVLADEFLNMQGSLGHLEHGAAVAQARSAMRREVEDLEGPRAVQSGMAVTGRQVLREAEKRDATIADPNSLMASLARKANVFSFAHALMSPSHMITASMEAHTNSMAILGARHNWGRAGLALTTAMRQAGPTMFTTGVRKTLAAVRGELKATDWNMSDLLRDRFIKAGANRAGMNMLFKRLEDAGLIDHTMLKDMHDQALATGGTRTGKTWNYFMNLSQVSAHSVDAMNKGVIAKAAFDLEFRKTGDINKAVDYAVETARTAMPNYNLANKPRIATANGFLGQLGSPLMQFKMYGMHMYTIMSNMAKVGMGSGEKAREARYAFAGLLATHAMSAGVLTLIADPLRYIGGAYDALTGATKPHDREADVRGWLSDVMGPTAGEAFARGLPHLLGFDVHSRVGLGNLLEVPELPSFDSSGVGKLMLGLTTGATGEGIQKLVDGFHKAMAGDVIGGVQDAIPRPIRDAMKAGDLASKGVQTQQGRTILPASRISGWDVALQAAGFQPSRVTEAREGSYAVQQARDEAKAQHDQLVKAWVSADPADRPAIMSQIRDYTSDPLHKGFPINHDTLLKALQARTKAGRIPPEAFGLTLPKRGAAALEQAGRFANYQ